MARSRDLGKLPFELKGGTVKTILSKGSNDDYDFVFRNLEAADMPTGIDALNISTGVVSNTEFNYLDGVTSNIQGQIDAIKGIKHATASGTDTYTATITGVTSYADGDAYLIRFTNGNTTGCTLNINSLGAKTLYRNNDGALIGGDIVDGGEMLCVYNSTLNGFQAIGTAPNTLLGYVTNADSVAITKGMPVYAFGGTGDRMTVKRAYNTGDATSAQTVGLVLSSSIAANQKGLIIMQGLLDGLNILPTSTFADGDPIYLGATAGTITNVKPYAPNHLVYLGVVTTASNGNAGRMYVRVQNGYELDELHNVQAQTPSTNDVLYYYGGNQWKTASIPSVLGYTPGTVSSVAALTLGTSGTNLSSTVANGTTTPVITLNVPDASATARGALTSTDWSTFNSKQAALVGTGFVKSTAGTISYDTNTYLTGNQTITLGGDLSGSGTTSITASIGANKVTVAMLAQAAANSILGNNTGSPANVSYLSGTSVTAMLDTFTSTLKGLTPASGGGTTKFLRADGNWAALAYTFSTGLTESAGTVTANLSTGVSGGQSVVGGSASGNSLTLTSTSNATKGNIIFGSAGLSVYDEVNNRFGINITAPSAALHIVTNISAESFWSDRYVGTTAAGAPGIILRKARGTSSSPTAAQSGDTLGVFGFRGYGSTAFSSGSRAALLAYAAETWTDTAQGTYLAYSTTINGSTTLSEKLRIDNDGNVLIGTTTNGGFKLDVNGTFRSQGDVTIADAKNIILNTTTGTKIGTATTQKIGFWNAAPIIQPTTAISTSITFTANTGTAINSASTFGGYTIIQVIQALKNLGIIA